MAPIVGHMRLLVRAQALGEGWVGGDQNAHPRCHVGRRPGSESRHGVRTRRERATRAVGERWHVSDEKERGRTRDPPAGQTTSGHVTGSQRHGTIKGIPSVLPTSFSRSHWLQACRMSSLHTTRPRFDDRRLLSRALIMPLEHTYTSISTSPQKSYPRNGAAPRGGRRADARRIAREAVAPPPDRGHTEISQYRARRRQPPSHSCEHRVARY